MYKEFNTTGLCIRKKHYMVDISDRINVIENFVDKGKYFVMNRPRQYGKTTTLNELYNKLSRKYLVIFISFEGLDTEDFSKSDTFIKELLELISYELNEGDSEIFRKLTKDVYNFKSFSRAISSFIDIIKKDVLLLIDEVDKSLENQVFLSFLGILREKYLLREADRGSTFKSVILAGVYDIKNLKLKLRSDEEHKYNSPWNIAIPFNVSMSLSKKGIEGMLNEYASDNNVKMNISQIADGIIYYTDGYPFLVSRLCQIVDLDLSRIWNTENVIRAVKLLLSEENTLFDDLVKNLQNNIKLREYLFDLVMNNADKSFNIDNPIIDLGAVFGYFKNSEGKVKISNRIFEQRLYNYFSSELENTVDMKGYNIKSLFVKESGLDIEKILLRFQQFMKEQYSTIDEEERKYLFTYVHRCKFHTPKASFGMSLKREGRLLFLAFIKPIINGVGFDFKEVQISEEKRLDVVITYNNHKYIIELKIWRGESYHKKGLSQLVDYLDTNSLKKGYLVIFDFNKKKEYKSKKLQIEEKDIFAVFV